MRTIVAVAAITIMSSSAYADDGSTQFLNVGLIGSASAGRHAMVGLGVEATLTSFDADEHGLGGYVQIETGAPASATSWSALRDQKRYATGIMYMRGWWGVEAGAMLRTAPLLDPTLGAQLGIFTSIGFASIEARAGVAPSGSDAHPQTGSDIGIVLASKFPMQVGGKATAIKGVRLLPCIWRCRE